MKNIDKTYYFISGMPHAGSDLLADILAQNPRFHTSTSSGIVDIMFGIRNMWDNLLEFKTPQNEPAKLRVLRGVLDNYYSDIDKPVVFDNGLGWISLLEMAEMVLGHKAKILVPVRDVREVLASLEKLWRANSANSQMSQENANYFQFQTVQGRTEVWSRLDQPVGLAYNRITDALHRGFADRMFFVDYDDLTNNPEKTMKSIYEFLGEKNFKHNFDKVSVVAPEWPSVLGDFAEKHGKLNFWKKK